MILEVKLKNAKYTMRLESNSMTVDCTYTGTDKEGNPKEMTAILGYYGPAQVDVAIKRIIAEELTQDEERVSLREFLLRYRAIHETIVPQLAEIKQALVSNK